MAMLNAASFKVGDGCSMVKCHGAQASTMLIRVAIMGTPDWHA